MRRNAPSKNTYKKTKVARAISAYETEEYFIPSSDGESSLYVRHFSRGKPRLHFLIVHGAMEHSGRHQELVDFWLRSYNEVAVTVYDHVGHGKSGGPRLFVPSFKTYVEDFLKVGSYIQTKNNDETKTFICAHSLGGLITLTCFLDSSYGWPYPMHGMMFSSPCIRAKLVLGPASVPLLEKLNLFISRVHLPMIYGGSDLTRDPARANDFDTDTLIPRSISVRMAKEVIDGCDRIRGLSYYLRTPSLFLIAGKDKIVDPESTTLFAHGIDKRITEIIQYPNHYHELWNEIDRQSIFETMKKWLEKRLKENS